MLVAPGVLSGTPAVMKLLLEEKLINGDCLTITGKTVAENLDELDAPAPDGKVVVVQGWLYDCPYCWREAPEIVRLHQKFGDRVSFVGLSSDLAEDAVSDKFVDRCHVGGLDLIVRERDRVVAEHHAVFVDRHRVGAQRDEPRQLGTGRHQGTPRRERADVQLVDDEILERGRGPAVVGPGERSRVENARRAAQAGGLPARGREEPREAVRRGLRRA